MRRAVADINRDYPKMKSILNQTWYTLPLVASDLHECAELDYYYAHDAKDSDQLLALMRPVRTVGQKMLNLDDGHIDAYCLYEPHRGFLSVSRFVFSTEDAGHALCRMLQQKGRSLVEVIVDEYDLRTQKLLQRNGFRWFSTARGEQSDVYVMRWIDAVV
jgi:hypothetical protein